jgi:hypothetical protein
MGKPLMDYGAVGDYREVGFDDAEDKAKHAM